MAGGSFVGGRARSYADATLAAVVVLMVGMMIVPLPTALLDVLIAANISVAVLMLLVAMYVSGGLAFTAFPTVLLVTTLYRLSLNVSSTRLILLQADAGTVIDAFGEFVVRGNYVVGAVVFLILTLIQFLVIAKGSERVAEVGARFTLDAMPGKQMSIDAELRAGAITQDQARVKRRMLQRESQFYGAMDGAMKFVKGDAIAGIVITLVNVLGGLAIGIGMHGMAAIEALETYGLLTIGDGLVSQIPALLISTSAGLVVTRVAAEEEGTSLGTDVATQIFGNRRALAVAAVFLVVLALVPGLPTVPFLLLGGLFGTTSFRLARPAAQAPAEGPAGTGAEPGAGGAPADRTQRPLVPLLVPVAVDLGETLAARVLPSGGGGPLLDRHLPDVRDALFLELGVTLPAVRVRPSPDLEADAYVISLQEVVVGRGTADTDDDPAATVARHLGQAVRRRAHELVGLQETQAMLDQLERAYPALVRNVVPKPVPLPLLAEVLRRLVEEGVSVRPLREILEALATYAPAERDPVALTELVRGALRRQITYRFAREGELQVHLLDPAIEDAVRDAVQRTATGAYLAMPPDQAQEVIAAARSACTPSADGRPPILLTQADVRRFVRRLLEVELPDLVVLSYQELAPEVTVQPVGRVALAGAGAA
ncbi:MAG: FHIPEP family type III secretion protein [Myxococcota bacterium]